MAPRALLCLALALGCNAPSPSPGGPDQGPDPAALKAICASEFGGGMARVEVWRDHTGTIKLLGLFPDLARYSHPPLTLFDPSGTELLVVPERPVSPAERERDPVLRKLDELQRNLRRDDAPPSLCSF